MSDFTEMGGSLEADTGKLRLSRPQWLLMLHLYSTWCGNFEELNQHLVQDAMTRKLPTLVSIFKGFHVSGQKKLLSAFECFLYLIRKLMYGYVKNFCDDSI